MSADRTAAIRAVVTEKLVDASPLRLADSTPRRVHGWLHVPGKATAVVGMRRAGKTTLLHQVRAARAGDTPPEWLPYFNFEDERLGRMEASHLAFIVEEHARIFGHAPSGRMAWFFDEIQLVVGWERFVRRLLDSNAADIFVTGSSAKMLSREIKTELRGRGWAVVLHPFSFEEYLRHHAVSMPKRLGGMSSSERTAVEGAFRRYLQIGGFPEVQDHDAYTSALLLRDYVDVAVLRDVIERHEVRNPTALRWMVRHLLANAAGPFSANKFYNALKSQGVAVSKDTVHEFIGHLEDCFLVRVVDMETDSERQRMVNPRKVYPIDTGLIPIFDRSGKANTGHALETAVLLELERRRFEVTYVKTAEGYKVDFLARAPDGTTTLIQVAEDAVDPKTRERELRSLVEASEAFPRASIVLLTLTRDGLPAVVPEGMRAMPAYEWMLADETER